MKLIISPKANINYLAKVVKIEKFKPHSDPEVIKLKSCVIDGFNIICGIDYEPGIYVYFPTSCQINPNFLKYANLYKHKELNNDSTKSGMFEDNGRVKAIKLRGEISEGFILPIVILENYILSVTNISLEYEEGIEFDSVEHKGKTFWINKKYIVQEPKTKGFKVEGGKSKQPKGIDKIIENQFRFHYDTQLLKKTPRAIKYNDIIQVSSKIHGTSGISAYVLCKQSLNWKQKIAKWLTGEEFNSYDYIYSSRSVIKNKYYNKNVSDGYYGIDVWKYADDVVRPWLKKGETCYYEIAGYLPNGKYIQQGYDYGCIPPKEGEQYINGVHFKIFVYRVTLTNVNGNVHEYSAREVQQWCERNGLEAVEQYYYGYAGHLYPKINVDENWSEEFLHKLSDDKDFYMECDSPICKNKVPHEGIVIRIENGQSSAFKLKTFYFLNKEQKDLDKGESNIEDEN